MIASKPKRCMPRSTRPRQPFWRLGGHAGALDDATTAKIAIATAVSSGLVTASANKPNDWGAAGCCVQRANAADSLRLAGWPQGKGEVSVGRSATSQRGRNWGTGKEDGAIQQPGSGCWGKKTQGCCRLGGNICSAQAAERQPECNNASGREDALTN